MYQKPTLNRVGDAQEVILGIYPSGGDFDMNFLPGNTEYADDAGEGTLALSWS